MGTTDRFSRRVATGAWEDDGVVQQAAVELAESLRGLTSSPAPAGEARPQGEGAVLRTFGIGAQILKDLGVSRMRVLSAPKQMHGISAFGLEVEAYVGEEG